jgi:hypothetical protein
MAARNYVWIPNWEGSDDNPEGFQHYKNRDPIWIKNYTRLLSKDEYLALSGHRRGVLHGIWLAYATSRRRLPHETLTLTRRLGLKVTTADLASLNHAGFIEVVASDVLAERLQDASPHARPRARGELEVEEEQDQSLVARGQADNGTAPPLADDDIPFDIPNDLVKAMPD